jgi:hypothetical protein
MVIVTSALLPVAGSKYARRVTVSSLLALAADRYVLLTTYRRSGAPVGTAVWVVRSGDELLITTGGLSGKVKRLRADPRVQLVACDIRGAVADGAVPVPALAEVTTDPEVRARLEAALEEKYGDRYREIRAAGRQRVPGGDSVALVIRAVP